MRVALVATGMMELHGLGECLGRLFPAHAFEVIARVPARPGVPAQPFDQGLTHRIDPAAITDVPTNLVKLVRELSGLVYPRRADAVDLAVVVDDLELWNIDQPAAAVEAVRRTVQHHVEQSALKPYETRELARCLRERASFHLAVPMTEAWFYGDPASFAANGVPASRTARVKEGVDPEQFETDDALYSIDNGSACAKMLERNTRRSWDQRRAPWVLVPQPGAPWLTRERHPKAYLQWLCRDPEENGCTSWQESKAGAAALQKLDWTAVLAIPEHCPYARALVDDLADALGEPTPFPAGGTIAPLTARKARGHDLALRNL